MCGDNLLDISVEYASQKVPEAWSFPVESGADVTDKLVIFAVLLMEVGELSLEVVSPVFAANV